MSSVLLSLVTTCPRALRRKLVEFLEVHQGNHSVYNYTQEFNNLA
jgi:hypothetical protein